jgi:hypothetical protein
MERQPADLGDFIDGSADIEHDLHPHLHGLERTGLPIAAGHGDVLDLVGFSDRHHPSESQLGELGRRVHTDVVQ